MPPVPTSEAEFRHEQMRIMRNLGIAFLFCGVLLGGAQLFLQDLIAFPGEDLEGRLTFLAGANLLLILWIIIGVGMVSRGRRHSREDIAGSAYARPGPKIALAAAFLQNTLEQAIIAVVVFSALVMLAGAVAIPFVAVSVLLFGVGRIAFLRGYPKGAGARAFGMGVTMIPTLMGFVWAVVAMIAG